MAEQQRIKHINERLQRWAWWHWSSRVGGHYAAVKWAERVDGGNLPPPTPMSVGDEEAIETDQVVAALPVRERGAVLAVYLDREGCSMEQIAGKVRCTRTTLHNRLCDADRRIAMALLDRAQGRAAMAEREREAGHERAASRMALAGADCD
ncbi:MAG: hypothetical protein RR326_01150 [Stenotrophomonas sp.]